MEIVDPEPIGDPDQVPPGKLIDMALAAHHNALCV